MSATLEAPELASRWGLFAHRDFRLLWSGQTVSRLGSSITSIALPLVAVLALDAGPTAVGLLTAAAWLPWLFFGLPAGVWVGRASRRSVMILCNLASAALFAGVPLASWLGVLTLGQLLAVAFLTGTAAVFFDAAFHAYLPELVPADGLIEANAKLEGSASAANVAGRGLAGLTVQLLGAAAGLLADAVSFLIAAATLRAIRARPAAPAAPPVRGALLREVREGLAFLWRDPYLRAFTLYGAAANFALTGGYQSVVALFLVRDAGIAPGWVGALASAGALGGVLGALVARPLCRRLGTARGLRIVLLTVPPVGLLMPLAGPGARVAFYVVGLFGVVAAVTLVNVVLASFRQSYTPPALLTRVTASAMVTGYTLIPLGALAGGALGDLVGTRATMWVMTTLLALCGALPLASPLRTLRDLPGRPDGSGPSDSRS